MDLSSLHTKIERSPLLNEDERAYWTGNLPKMNAVQLEKLETVLIEAERISWDEEAQHYLSIVNKVATLAV